MTKIVEGKLDARGIKIGIIVSRFNNFITEKLLNGALDGLKSHGAKRMMLPLFVCPVHSKYPWWLTEWQPAENTMRWFV